MCDKKDIQSRAVNETFIINIQFCESETWQGSITWADQNKSKYFRSTMEMIKLMDGIVNAKSKSE